MLREETDIWDRRLRTIYSAALKELRPMRRETQQRQHNVKSIRDITNERSNQSVFAAKKIIMEKTN